MTAPNFIIVGVARCGTTSLYHYLKQHPQIGFPKVKEPKYFSSSGIVFPHNGPGDHTVDAKIIRDKKQYYDLFADLNDFKAIGEASSDYFYYHKNTVPAIKQELGDVKIILCFRNPIERAYSAYSNLLRDSRETITFDEAISLEEERIAKNYDWMWAYKKGGLYAEGLKLFQDTFSNVKVILLEDLEREPKRILEDVFEFLEVDPYDNIDVSTKFSHSGKPKNKLIAKITDRNNKFFYTIREAVLKLVPRKITEKIAAKLFQKDEININTRKQLQVFFEKDIAQTAQLLNKSLNHWK
ncbi:MAG: sulfotransferase [Crocinitomicaceae bacterium]|nr:sulfotransferase [Crocinitomicaceae bacterium]